MLVPKYTAQANRVTGVSGQQMSFKVPGGALSQASGAQAQAYTQLSQQASQWGAVAYKMHRDTVVAGAVAKGKAGIDDAHNKSQRQAIDDPKYVNKGGGIVGYFNEKVTSLLKVAGSTSFDPLTNRRISAELSGYVAGQRRTLDRYYAGRLVDQAKANLNAGTEAAVRVAGNALPPNWDGDEATLPPAVIEEIRKSESAQSDAANIGVTTAVAAGKANQNLRSEIAEYAVNTRITSAQTSDQMEQLLGLLDDPKNFRWLDPLVRNGLVKSARYKSDQLDNKEFRDEARARTAAEKALKKRQNQRATSLWDRIFSARQGEDDVMPTSEEILFLSNEDNGLGLQNGHIEMFMNMIEDTGPKHTDGVLLAEMTTDVLDIIDKDLSGVETSDQINAVIERAARQVAKGTQSRLKIDDFMSFIKWARGAAKGDVDVAEIQRYRSIVSGAVNPININTGLPEDRRNNIRVAGAIGFYDKQIKRGKTPLQAIMDTFKRFGITTDPIEGTTSSKPYLPPYPFGIPDKISGLDIPLDVTKWKGEHVEAARRWANANMSFAAFGRTVKDRNDKYQDLNKDFVRIEEYIAQVKAGQN